MNNLINFTIDKLWNKYLNSNKTEETLNYIIIYLKDKIDNNFKSEYFGAYISLITHEALRLYTIENNKKLYNVVIDVYNKLNMYNYCLSTIKGESFKKLTCNKEKYEIINAFFTNKFYYKNNCIIIPIIDLFVIFQPNEYKKDISYNVDKLIETINIFYSDKIEEIIKFILIDKNTNLNAEYINFLRGVADKLIPDDYKYNKILLGTLFHLGEFPILVKNNLINIEFLEYCYNEWIKESKYTLDYYNGILNDIKHSNYSLLTMTWKKDKNKLIPYEGTISEKDKWINKIDFFLEKKVFPTKRLFNGICNFINMLYGKMYISDMTGIVMLIINFGYEFTIDDVVMMLKKSLIITNIDDYDFDLRDKDLLDVTIKMDYNPYNIKLIYTDDLLEEKCNKRLNISDINIILKENKDLKLNEKCLENLCKSSDLQTVKAVINKYDLKPNMKCVKNAIDSGWGKLGITQLFNMAYPLYLKELDEYKKKINIKKEQIEVKLTKKIDKKSIKK
jgi:hypothetical protein